MAITRTPIIDDDGSGTTGTVLDNAWKQELYGQIDASLSPIASYQLTRGNGVNTSPTAANLVMFLMPPLGFLDTLKIYVTIYQGTGTSGAVTLSAYGDTQILRLDDIGGGSLTAGRFGTWEITMRTDPQNALVRTTSAIGGTLPIGTAAGTPLAARGSAMVLAASSWTNGNWNLSVDAGSTGAMTQYWHWAVYRLI